MAIHIRPAYHGAKLSTPTAEAALPQSPRITRVGKTVSSVSNAPVVDGFGLTVRVRKWWTTTVAAANSPAAAASRLPGAETLWPQMVTPPMSVAVAGAYHHGPGFKKSSIATALFVRFSNAMSLCGSNWFIFAILESYRVVSKLSSK